MGIKRQKYKKYYFVVAQDYEHEPSLNRRYPGLADAKKACWFFTNTVGSSSCSLPHIKDVSKCCLKQLGHTFAGFDGFSPNLLSQNGAYFALALHRHNTCPGLVQSIWFAVVLCKTGTVLPLFCICMCEITRTNREWCFNQ